MVTFNNRVPAARNLQGQEGNRFCEYKRMCDASRKVGGVEAKAIEALNPILEKT